MAERTIIEGRRQAIATPTRFARERGALPGSGITVRGSLGRRFSEILTPAALDFLTELDQRFAWRRVEVLAARRSRQAEINCGVEPDFLTSTAGIREDPSWTVTAPGPGLADRGAEISGPPTRTMTVAALSSGAEIWVADFEDGTSPTWHNIVDGQVNLSDAIRRQITDEPGRSEPIARQPPTIMVRPRGWQLCEKHLIIDGHPVPAALVDFGLYFFHNARELISRGTGPYFSLPKLQSHTEARLWNDIFIWAQDKLGIPPGTVRASCLIETLPAALEMEEILYELRDHSAGLDADRRGYLFSMIKTMGSRSSHLLPDRSDITMDKPFLRAYTDLLVQTCHARGAYAPQRLGMSGDGAIITADQLLDVSGLDGSITIDGIRTNIRISLRYLAAWVAGQSTVTIDQQMADAATIEVSRMQLWQWIRHGARTDEGLIVTRSVVNRYLDEELTKLERSTDPADRVQLASARDILVTCCQLDTKDGDESEAVPPYFTGYAYPRYLVQRTLTFG